MDDGQLTKREIDMMQSLIDKERKSIRKRKIRASEKMMGIVAWDEIEKKLVRLDISLQSSKPEPTDGG